jgi:hypothetical protein
MPLLDHFNPPLSRTHPWRGFHGAWAATMARLLNHGVLPPGYYAVPLVGLDGPVEIDIATLYEQSTPGSDQSSPAPQTWTAPAPALSLTVELPTVDALEVQVFSDEGDPRLVAAIELVSPRNKDRPTARRAFAVKCVGYLQQGSGVVVVDIVTTRRTELHAAILALMNREPDPDLMPWGLSAVSYHAVALEPATQQLRLWPASLTLAQPLPTLPLWIGADLAVPLDLEASYQAACADLLIHHAG